MNRRYCYNTDCDEDRCRCYDEQDKLDDEVQSAMMEYNESLMALIGILTRIELNQKRRLELLQKVNPVLKEVINIYGKK